MQGIFLVISMAVLTASLLADIAYVIADPRARVAGGVADGSMTTPQLSRRHARGRRRAPEEPSLARRARHLARAAAQGKVGVRDPRLFVLLVAIIGPASRPYDPTPPPPVRRCRWPPT